VADSVHGQRQRLLVALASIIADVAGLEFDHARLIEAAQASNADDEHDPEGATIAFEREQLTAMLTRARQTKVELELALTDVDRGSYGVCERCERPIDPARLEVRPHTRLCIDCALTTRTTGNAAPIGRPAHRADQPPTP
jgi:DnaK suppressor protein